MNRTQNVTTSLKNFYFFYIQHLYCVNVHIFSFYTGSQITREDDWNDDWKSEVCRVSAVILALWASQECHPSPMKC